MPMPRVWTHVQEADQVRYRDWYSNTESKFIWENNRLCKVRNKEEKGLSSQQTNYTFHISNRGKNNKLQAHGLGKQLTFTNGDYDRGTK